MPQARYKQLVDAYAADIREGRLAPGTRLPTHRQLAASQGLALVTASRVYAELESMGLVSGETGRGTFVREPEWPTFLGTDTQTAAASMADLSFNYPSLPGQAEQLRAALRQLAQSGDLDALLRYQPHGGRPHERAVAAPSGHARTAGAGRARADRLRRPAWPSPPPPPAAGRRGGGGCADLLRLQGRPRRSAWNWRQSRSAPRGRTWMRWNACAPRARRHLHADAAQSARVGAGPGWPRAPGGHRAPP